MAETFFRAKVKPLTPPDLEEERMEETIKPATDTELADFAVGREIAIYRREQDGYMHCVECDASPVGGARSGHRGLCSFQAWPKIQARIDSDRALISELVKALEKAKTYIHAPWRPDDVVTAMLSEIDAALAKARAARPVSEEENRG
jgi:hypothetical protein